jgi:hypothetical protein
MDEWMDKEACDQLGSSSSQPVLSLGPFGSDFLFIACGTLGYFCN